MKDRTFDKAKWQRENPDKVSIASKKWREQNKPRKAAYAKKWASRNPARTRASHLKNAYGLSLDAYETMRDAQGGLCAICNRPEGTTVATRLCVDHDHRTGVVRALLCHACNIGLGKFKDDPEIVRLALGYIERHRRR